MTPLRSLMALLAVSMTILATPALSADASKSNQYEITKVSDGDSLRAGELRIRLHGIDAPEIRQQCTYEGLSYPCGRQAKAYLEEIIAGQGGVMCEHLDTDRYQRLIMRCFHRGIDIGATMVRSGWAVAYRRYSHDYVADENAARAEAIGMWAGAFQHPEEWRRQN